MSTVKPYAETLPPANALAPTWEEGLGPFDWRFYVPPDAREQWATESEWSRQNRARQCLYRAMRAQHVAENPLTVAEVMESLEPRKRRWCGGGLCACMGCANSLLREYGYDKADFDAWLAEQAAASVSQ